ncbi:MAG: HAD hydrolase family protein [Ardenticatenaceae bacterium]
MKFKVLALDYDGTIAQHGTLDPDVRVALDAVRMRGISVILVTGRIFSELRRVAGDLDFVDAVVGENGAVLAFPNSSGVKRLANPPEPRFLSELARRGIEVMAGQCVVEADASLAPRILEVIHDLELPLTLLYNRSRLMVLPQGISKATGLYEALRTLRLSRHNTLAIGDAENDHALLEFCELGVAVGWGSEALKKVADEVLEGDGPAAVADYILQTAEAPLLPQRALHRQLHLGHRVIEGGKGGKKAYPEPEGNGEPLTLAIKGRNVLIAGDPQSGKSWLAGLLAEQMILQQYNVCIIDPEGDYATVESLPGVIVLGTNEPPPCTSEILRLLRYPDVSVVVDLSRMEQSQKCERARELLSKLVEQRRCTGLPHRIVIDEAHYFLQEPNLNDLLDMELGAYTLVTYCPSALPLTVLVSSEVRLVTQITNAYEVRVLAGLSGARQHEAKWQTILPNLAIDQAALLPGIEESGRELHRFRIAPRLTAHVRHRHKYLDVPVPEHQAFIFTDAGVPTGRRARTLRELVTQLAASAPNVIEAHLQRSDFSRWIRKVFQDKSLALHIRMLEQQHQSDPTAESQESLTNLITLIEERYLANDQPSPVISNQ